MPVTRATARASLGAAQAPSTIYTNYNEIVSLIQGGLPPRRARRVPKRPREESQPIPTEIVLEYKIFGTRDYPTSTSTSTSIKKAAKWCAEHLGECKDGCVGSVEPEWSEEDFYKELSKWSQRIRESHESSWDCPLCKDHFWACDGNCYLNPIPKEIFDAMSPTKLLSLHLNTLIRIAEEFC